MRLPSSPRHRGSARTRTSAEEVARFLEAVPGLRSRAALTTAYGAGLRVSEVAALKIGAISTAAAC